MRAPVIIVGGGPVGLCLAWALVLAKRRVVLLESHERISRDPRANTFQPTTLELLHGWGVLTPLLEKGQRAQSITYWDWNERKATADFDFGQLAGETPFPFRLHLPQWELVDLLMQRLLESEYARVHMGCTVTAIHTNADGVRVEAQSKNGRHAVEGLYVVGADGTHSSVRDELGIGFEFEHRPVRFITFETSNRLLVALAEEVNRRPAHVNVLVSDNNWAIAMTMRNSVRVVMPEVVDPDRTAAELTPRAVRRHLAEELELSVEGAIKHRGVYTVQSRIVDTMRRGRVFLIGDAAHSTNPAGGSAMNSGIEDAAALANALCDGRERVLQEFDRARRESVRQRVAIPAHHAYNILAAKGPWERRALNRYLAMTANEPDSARAHVMRLSMMEERLSGAPPEFGLAT